jgi:hypothetical protein
MADRRRKNDRQRDPEGGNQHPVLTTDEIHGSIVL